MERAYIALLTAFILLLVMGFVSLGGGELSTEQTVDAFEEPRYVTVTFDDAYSSQGTAAEELEQHGMRGVFFVPTGRLNDSFEGIPTMTAADVQRLAANGHEIGGHTYNHTNVSTLTAQEAAAAMERNRAALQDMGVQPVSFAYPYGAVAHTDTVHNYYSFARANGWKLNNATSDTPKTVHTVSLTENNAHVLDDYLNRMDAGDWLVISVHHVEDSGFLERPQVDMRQDTYESLLYTIETANNTEVVTFQEMMQQ